MKRLLVTIPLILLTACASASKAVTTTEDAALVISPVPTEMETVVASDVTPTPPVPAEMETVTPTLVPALGESVRVGFNVRGWT